MNRTRWGIALTVVTLAVEMVGLPAWAQDPTREGEQGIKIPRRVADAGSDELRRALVDRYNASAELIESNSEYYELGQLTIDRLLDSIAAAGRCELHLVSTPSEEVEVWERTVKRLRRVEDRERDRLKVGSAAAPGVAEAHFKRLDAEVQLLIATQKAAGK